VTPRSVGQFNNAGQFGLGLVFDVAVLEHGFILRLANSTCRTRWLWSTSNSALKCSGAAPVALEASWMALITRFTRTFSPLMLVMPRTLRRKMIRAASWQMRRMRRFASTVR